VITEGGVVGNEMVIADPGISLSPGYAGIFFIHESNYPVSKFTGKNSNFELYSASQGFIQYELTNRTAHDPFKSYTDIPVELYSSLLKLNNQKSFNTVKPFDLFVKENKKEPM